jgi:hypothetical protein
LENRRLLPSSENLATESLRKVGDENAQNSPKKYAQIFSSTVGKTEMLSCQE